MKRMVFVLGVVALTGCVLAEEPAVSTCGAGAMQGQIGKDRSILAAMSFPAGTRIIEPGMMITEDYRPERLNIDLDDKGLIARVWCG